MRVVNLGAQVDVADLAAAREAERADAVLVSQVVTQRDAHLASTRTLAEAFGAAPPHAGPPGPGPAAPCWSSAAPGSTRRWRPNWAWTRSSAAAPRPREVASYLVHASPPSPPRQEPGHDPHRPT